MLYACRTAPLHHSRDTSPTITVSPGCFVRSNLSSLFFDSVYTFLFPSESQKGC